MRFVIGVSMSAYFKVISETEGFESGQKEVVRRFLCLMSTGNPEDMEKAASLFAEDATFWIIGNLAMSGTLHGREQILEKLFRPNFKRIVPGTVTLKLGKVIAEGEYVAAEWTSRRKVIDSKDYENTFFGLFRVKNGRIHSLREYMDTLSVKEAGWSRED